MKNCGGKLAFLLGRCGSMFSSVWCVLSKLKQTLTLPNVLFDSSEQGQISLKSHVSDWAFGNEEEADSGMHSSWGLQKNPAMVTFTCPYILS